MEATYLVVHDIRVGQDQILVGATDNVRWAWETEDGETGANATTLVSAILTKCKSGYILEQMDFFCDRHDTLRPLVIKHVEDLLKMAWKIYDNKWNWDQANEAYYGYKL